MFRSPGFILLAAVTLNVSTAASDLPQKHAEVKDFGSGGSLRIHVRACGLRIVKGSDPAHIRLSYTAKVHDEDASERVHKRFDVHGSEAEIELSAPNRVNLDAEIEVPSPTSLRVRMFVGDLTVEGGEGDVDIENHIGDIVFKLGPQDRYKLMDASTHIGDLDGFPGRVHGWLGKSGKFLGSGPYRLHAHVGVGDIRFQFE
jgi:hypothetical protein